MPPVVSKIDPTLRMKPKKPSCLDPGKKDYEVEELEQAILCKDSYASKLEARFDSLAKASASVEK